MSGNCTFEEGNCGFTNSYADTFDWSRNSIGDETFYSNMPSDHTVTGNFITCINGMFRVRIFKVSLNERIEEIFEQ